MAIVFELFVECETEEQSEHQARHFEGLAFTLISGLEVAWNCETEQIPNGNSGIVLWSPQLNMYGVRSVRDAVDMSECGIRLYHHLRAAPEFFFARVAIESNISAQQIGDFCKVQPDGFRTCSRNCVMHEQLVAKIGPLRFFREFRPGYVWNDYWGEDYRPLGSNDNGQLLRLKQQLFSV